MYLSLIVLTLLGGCKPEEEPASMVEGSFTVTSVSGEDLVGEVASRSAFGFNSGGRVIVYLASAEGVSCEDAATLLEGGDDTFDPSSLFEAGMCNLFVVGDHDGGEATYDDSGYDLTWVLNCTLGDGSFVYEERDANDWDYYWTGDYYQANPESWSATLSGGDGDPVGLEVELQDFMGYFIYDSGEDFPATGTVSGAVEATWCEDLKAASVF